LSGLAGRAAAERSQGEIFAHAHGFHSFPPSGTLVGPKIAVFDREQGRAPLRRSTAGGDWMILFGKGFGEIG